MQLLTAQLSVLYACMQYAFGHRLGNWILLPPQLLLLVGLEITYT